MTSRVSRSTTSLDSVDLSRSSKLDRLSKAYSLTDLSARPRRRTSSSDSLYSKGTASSRSKSQIGNEDSAKSRNLSRLTKNIEKDRNSEEKFSAAYREKWKGIMNQTSSRSETKKRDSALLSGTKPRLPTLNDKNPRQNGVTRSKAPVSNGGRARSGKPDLETAGARNGEKLDTGRARSRSSKPDLSTGQRKAGSDHTTGKPGRDNAKLGGGGKIGVGKVEESRPGGKKGFAGAVNRAAPTKTLAGTVKRATLANGQRTKQVDDFTLNKKYSESVCEPCKLQIHEKLKRGYTKYKSLDTMKACEKCKRVVIDFDFYQICIECAKSTAVCAKCASGSTKMTGARFVEVVRHGVEENILAMNSNELKKFAEKHAKIDIVERKIDDIEQLDDAKVHESLPNSRKTSGKSSRGSSVGSPSVRKISAKVNSPTRSTPSTKAATIARSLTSSSSPLVDKDGRHSGNESDEAYISGHISSTEIVKSASDPKRRNRKKSSDILRQIRSLSELEVTSPTLARSVLREIRSLTAIDTDEEDCDGETHTDLTEAEKLVYTPFSCAASDKSLEEDRFSPAAEETTRMSSRQSGQSTGGGDMCIEDYFPAGTPSPPPQYRAESNNSEVESVEDTHPHQGPIVGSDHGEHSDSEVEIASSKSADHSERLEESYRDHFWVEDVDVFDDREIDTQEEQLVIPDIQPMKRSEQRVSFNDEDRTIEIERDSPGGKEYNTEEECDVVEHVHIGRDDQQQESPRVVELNHRGNHDDNTSPELDLDLRLSAIADHRENLPRGETLLNDDIQVVDFMEETPRSEISMENGYVQESEDQSTNSETETRHENIVRNNHHEISEYEFDELHSDSKEDRGEMELMKTVHDGISARSKVLPTDVGVLSQESPGQDEDTPTSLRVVKGSPSDDHNGISHADNPDIRVSGRVGPELSYERQIGHDHELIDSKPDADAIIDKISEGFEQFVNYHQNHSFEVMEDHLDYGPEEGYYECYQYPYNPRLRIRLDDIPEEGTLSKETTYLSTVYTDTFDKEDTALFGRDDVIATRDPTMEDHALDIVSNALHNAVIQVKSCREPSR